MEDVLARHRKEQRDLQSRITQKKKAATKKTRKSVNDECGNLERDLADKQRLELAAVSGEPAVNGTESVANGAVDLGDLLDKRPYKQCEPSSLEIAVRDLGISEEPSKGQATTDEAVQRKPNRQKARLARRAAEHEALVAQAEQEAADLPDLKARERAIMLEEFEKRGLQEKEIAANGHCMYSAIADQMNVLEVDWRPEVEPDAHRQLNGAATNVQLDHRLMRKAAAAYISAHPEDFTPFLEEPLDVYLHKIKDTGEWGGQLELLALARTYKLNINVVQGNGRVEEVEGAEKGTSRSIWLAYYKHGFGLGEHYNSLRKKEAKGA